MKKIEITLTYPTTIRAVDHTDNQWVTVTRNDDQDLEDDEAVCTITSCLIGDDAPVEGQVLWADAFNEIQKMFNGTAL